MNLSAATLQFAACIAIATGAVSLYLGAPNQGWLSRALPAWPSRVAGAASLLLGALLWRQTVELSTAIFATLALTMLLFIAFPCLAALRTVIGNAP
ncbi:MAG: hypothetical protein AB7F41_08480 [Methylocystis sp.]|uniref:hypothetical protein n=1 Tax=Methylocystis sp. TaxID=1911079 RepID=UPI003D09E9B7